MSQLSVPETVYMGEGSLEKSGKDLQKLGKKALIVSGQSMIRQGHMKRLTDLLEDQGIEWILYPEISKEPTVKMVTKGAALSKENNCDFLIGFGGGSPMDAAKAISLALSTKEPLSNLMGKEIDWNLAPVAAIPSTAGTGSEVTRFTIVTDEDTDTKMLLKGDSLVPALAIVDPIFTLHAPESVTISSGLDALTHAIEAYTSIKATEDTDRYALSAIKKIFEYLPVVLDEPENMEARSQLSKAAFEAGIAFSNSSVTLVHGMSRPIGALFHVPHGISNAMLLADCMEYARPGAVERFAEMARTIGAADKTVTDKKASIKFLESLEELCTLCKVPTLQEYGINPVLFKEKIEKMSQDALASGSPGNTRRTPNAEDIKELYLKVINK